MSARRARRTRPFLRGAVALVTVCGVGLGVAACEVKPGAAAFVGNQKISEADVTKYLAKGPGVAPTGAGQSSARALILGNIVTQDLFVAYLSKNNALPSDSALAAAEDQISGGAQGRASLEQQATDLGLTTSFISLYVHAQALGSIVAQKSGATDSAALIAAVGKDAPTVKVSPRYGVWNPKTLNLDGSTPAYLQLSTGTSAA